MDKEFLASSIMTASPTQLVVITYDIFFQNVEDALSCMQSKDFDRFDKGIDDAKAAVRELMEALDMEYEISVDLMALYLQVQKLLVSAKAGRKMEKLELTRKIMAPLYDGWKQIAQKEQDGNIRNDRYAHDASRTSVVAGMTYGKSDINVLGNFGNEFKA